MAEGEALLDRFLENTPPLEPLHVEPELNHEEVSSDEAEPITIIERPSPEPEDSEERFPSFGPSMFRGQTFQKFGKYLKICMPKEATGTGHSFRSFR